MLPHLFTHDLTLLIVPCALLLSLVKPQVPLGMGIGLVVLAILPAVNYLIPTIMAVALLYAIYRQPILLPRDKFALSWQITDD